MMFREGGAPMASRASFVQNGGAPAGLKLGWRSALTLSALALAAQAFAADDDTMRSGTQDSSVVRLQSPQSTTGTNADRRATDNDAAMAPPRAELPAPYVPNEFERYVQRVVRDDQLAGPQDAQGGADDQDGQNPPYARERIRRFGAELMTPGGRGGLAAESAAQIPSDYVVNVGDELLVTLWGSVDADLRLTVDRSGRITIPRVGPILVAGLHYADLDQAVDQRVAQVFRNYKLSVTLGKLRSIRVYVTGFSRRPGAYTVSSLATLVNAVMQAGGPSAAGSFRDIELRRGGKLVTRFDLYDLLLKGDKTADRSLQAEDVVFIGPIGPQAALIGSVNKPAVFELKPGETVNDVVAMAGGFSAVADHARLTVEHISDRADKRVTELALPSAGSEKPQNGDLLRAYSAVSAVLPLDKQNVRVRVEGEVRRPGEYILPAQTTMQAAIAAAGGLTSAAYIYGTDFSRESVRVVQEQNYERALRDLETQFARTTATQRTTSADDAAALVAQSQNSTRLIAQLRSVHPTGRIVLQMDPNRPALPELSLENGDRILIPARPTTVGVFGSVFNGGSFLYTQGSSVADSIKLAGGPTRGADPGSAFVIHANGSVVSARQKSSGWLSIGANDLDGVAAQPGDTVFVPEELNKTSWMQDAKDWTTILYQFGLGAAALKTIKQ